MAVAVRHIRGIPLLIASSRLRIRSGNTSNPNTRDRTRIRIRIVTVIATVMLADQGQVRKLPAWDACLALEHQWSLRPCLLSQIGMFPASSWHMLMRGIG